jgi:hypothetical protein
LFASDFYPVNPRFASDADFNIAKLKCLNNAPDLPLLAGLQPRHDSPIPVFGDYDSAVTQSFNIFL